MSSLDEVDELIATLATIGDDLALEDDGLVESVLHRVGGCDAAPGRTSSAIRPARLIVACLVAIVVAALAHPDGRGAMARWLGLDGVTVRVDPVLEPTGASGPPSLPGPGESQVVVVDGREILVSTIDGRLTDATITKTVRTADHVEEVQVNGLPALWIGAAGHEVSYTTDDGTQVRRMASNTLLWQNGPLLVRIEGFVSVDHAVAFAVGT